MKGWRKIHIGDLVYRYKFGKQFVVILHPDGKKETVAYSTLTGRTSDIIERGKWKGTTDGMVTPGHVKDYLERG